MKMPTLSFAGVVALQCVLPLWAESDNPPVSLADSSIRIIRYVRPQFPIRLAHLGVATGDVQVALEVAADGQLVDSLVTAYTDKEFAEATLGAIQSWLFAPARMDGKPAGSVVELTMHFETTGVLLVAKFDRGPKYSPGHYAYQACDPKRLDHLPKPVHVVEPFYPRQFYVEGATGAATVSFYIDETGRVRMPMVTGTTEGFLAAVAVAAVREWRFEPPTSEGRPALVRVSQGFHFVPQTGEN